MDIKLGLWSLCVHLSINMKNKDIDGPPIPLQPKVQDVDSTRLEVNSSKLEDELHNGVDEAGKGIDEADKESPNASNANPN